MPLCLVASICCVVRFCTRTLALANCGAVFDSHQHGMQGIQPIRVLNWKVACSMYAWLLAMQVSRSIAEPVACSQNALLLCNADNARVHMPEWHMLL